ncbi:MAG: outer membrane protein assembly factor BamD [Candidatus Marinimicrobia bacterium]|nr:outer membrane protein assembly factor BamD [Candidatus Neomarinimicrobiota bacterium]
MPKNATTNLLTLPRRIAGSLLVAMITLVLSACSSTDENEYIEQSVYEIYSQAIIFLDAGRYVDASLFFDEVERQHPYSVWATKAKLMSAYGHYHAGQFDDALTRLDRFISVHPGNRDVAYAYYLKALCYYEQIADVRRDQEMTQKAMEGLQDVITRFPTSPYGRDARLKLDLTLDHLAGKEMEVGRFYINQRHFLAAINRFKNVAENYNTTSHVPEALYRLSEAFTALGLPEEARKSAAVLGYNFPGTNWYSDAYALLGGETISQIAAESDVKDAQNVKGTSLDNNIR